MPVKKRVNRYEATVNHKGGRYRRSFLCESDAEAWEMNTKWALKHGHPVDTHNFAATKPTQGPTLQGLMKDTLHYEWRRTRNERAAALNAQHCVDHLGAERHPKDVTSRDIDDMRLAWEAQGVSSGTIANRLSALSKMLTFAVDYQIIAYKPRIKRPKKAEGRIRFLTKAEEEQLLGLLEGDARAIAVIGIDTGMRMSEILNLEMRDVGDRVVHIWENKTDAPRSIPLTARAWALISSRDALFCNWTVDQFDYRWNKARSRMGLGDDRQFVPHIMRHTFCSRLAQRGESPFAIMKLAGHRNIATTLRYAHLTTANLRTSIDNLELAV